MLNKDEERREEELRSLGFPSDDEELRKICLPTTFLWSR